MPIPNLTARQRAALADLGLKLDALRREARAESDRATEWEAQFAEGKASGLAQAIKLVREAVA